MKRMIKIQVFQALVLSLALVFPSCQSDIVEGLTNTESGLEGIISPEGGTLSLLNGEVTLQFPAGAVDFTGRITVRTCDDPAECIFLLKTISIEPLVTFNKPVKLIVRYDGSLMNNPEICCPGICTRSLIWDSPRDFLGHSEGKCIECSIDPG